LPFVTDYVIDDQFVTADDRKTLAYFHETAVPADREWWAAGVFAIADRQWFLSAYRNRAGGRFSHGEGRYLGRVATRFGKIAALAEKMERDRESSALGVLDQLKSAALLVDWRGAVRQVNRVTEGLLDDGLHLHHGRLWTEDSEGNRRIQELLAAIRVMVPGRSPSTHQVVVNRADAPWLLMEAMPVTPLSSGAFNEGRALLVLTDLTKPPVNDSRLLAIAFGLSPAEAKLAAQIASGTGIDMAARALRIGRETAKSQLKAVFLKTDTHSQPELVALLSRLRSAGRG
jgi:DNA-binding CsgD family transcriptional regulator